MGKAIRRDDWLAAAAHAQHGPFTYTQARQAGFSESAITRRVESGRWFAPHRGVLCDKAVPASAVRDISAAVLACGRGAAASHRSAAQLWGVESLVVRRPDVTVLTRARPPGVRIHATTRLLRTEAAPLDGIRVTSPMRTLVDLAEVVEAAEVELALDRLWRRRVVDLRRLVNYLGDPWCMHKRGSAALRALARERSGDRASGSDVETLLLQIIRNARLPLPVRQHRVVTPFGLRYLDLAYVERKIAIEVDGMESRFDREVFLDGRVRQNLIEAQGWTFRRFGFAHVTDNPLWTVFTLAEALHVQPTRWKRR